MIKENNFKERADSTASDANFARAFPDLWKRVSAMSVEEQDDRWFKLTQKHLSEYRNGFVDTSEFTEEEAELILINHVGAKDMPSISPETLQRGFVVLSKERPKKFETFGDFSGWVKQSIEARLKRGEGPAYVLVSGIGISGKATLRNVLTKELVNSMPDVRIVAIDRDYEKVFPPTVEADVYIVEDVHGLDAEYEGERIKRFNGSGGLPEGFDVLVYSLPSKATYKRSLLNRGLSWIRMGKIDLTAITHGENKTPEEATMGALQKAAAGELERTLQAGSAWFREQMRVLHQIKKSGIPMAAVDPTELFKILYGFKVDSSLAEKDFLTAIEESMKE